MMPETFSTGRGRGRDTLPLHPIPKPKTIAIYTEELTHLTIPLLPIAPSCSKISEESAVELVSQL